MSPKSYSNNPNDRDVIVKEGHRVVVVAYEKEGDGNTKVLISPQQHKSRGIVDDDAKGVIDDAKEEVEHRAGGPRELVCDAFGKCKHKIASAIGRTSEIVTEVKVEAKEAVGKVKDVGGKVKDAVVKVKEVDKDSPERIGDHIEGNVSRKIGETKEQVKEVEEMVEKGGAHKATERVGEMAEKAKDSVKSGAHRATERVGENSDKAKDSVKGCALKATERVGEMAEKAAETVKGGASRTTERVGEMAEKAADTVKDGSYTKEKAKKAADTVKDSVHRVKEEGEEISAKAGVDKVKEVGQKKKKDLREIFGRGKEVLHDIVMFLVWPNWMDSVMGVVHLLGFSLVLGMSMWVTFVSSHVLAGALPRQQFGMVQSKIYPVYFRVQSYCIGVALLGHLLSHRKRFFLSGIEMIHGFNFFASLLMALGNLLYLEPKATKVQKSYSTLTYGLEYFSLFQWLLLFSYLSSFNSKAY